MCAGGAPDGGLVGRGRFRRGRRSLLSRKCHVPRASSAASPAQAAGSRTSTCRRHRHLLQSH
eukprot:1468018-Alexandrium_andersonii.AAC.1